jgi:hypothetical protein
MKTAMGITMKDFDGFGGTLSFMSFLIFTVNFRSFSQGDAGFGMK